MGSDPKQVVQNFQKKQEKIGTTLLQIMYMFSSKIKELEEFLQKPIVE